MLRAGGLELKRSSRKKRGNSPDLLKPGWRPVEAKSTSPKNVGRLRARTLA